SHFPLNLGGNVYKIDTTVSWNGKFNHFILSINLSLTGELRCVKNDAKRPKHNHRTFERPQD
ncbi:MAG: hypothetical protein QQN63_14455, partial [Nitrosopumilus sp.]